jgi:hypothetical protein
MLTVSILSLEEDMGRGRDTKDPQSRQGDAVVHYTLYLPVRVVLLFMIMIFTDHRSSVLHIVSPSSSFLNFPK